MRRPWLAPLVPLYAAGAALRSVGLGAGLRRVRRLQWPVVSVGNLSVGGAGKTPFTIALAKLLSQHVLLDILSRGYGREDHYPVRVEPTGTALRFGDEPLMIANVSGVTVYVGAERWKAGRVAEREWEASGLASSTHLGVHLLDDGFQHRQLARKVDVVMVSTEDLEDSLLPAGNLREGLGALKRAHVLAVQDTDEAAIERLDALGFGPAAGQPIWRYRREMIVPPLPGALSTWPVVAFCGIARPNQFFSGLEQKGLHVAARLPFPDHHPYTPADILRLRRAVRTAGAGALVTTAKDFYRLGDLGVALNSDEPVFAVDLHIVLEDEAGVLQWLWQALRLAKV